MFFFQPIKIEELGVEDHLTLNKTKCLARHWLLRFSVRAVNVLYTVLALKGGPQGKAGICGDVLMTVETERYLDSLHLLPFFVIFGTTFVSRIKS